MAFGLLGERGTRKAAADHVDCGHVGNFAKQMNIFVMIGWSSESQLWHKHVPQP